MIRKVFYSEFRTPAYVRRGRHRGSQPGFSSMGCMTGRGLWFSLLLFLLFPGRVMAQRIVTLRECYEMAEVVSPLSAEKKLYGDIAHLRDINLEKRWLPSLDAGGQLVYNSEVVDLTGVMGALPLPGIDQLIKPLPHEQYKLTLDVNQMIYDGGSVKGARTLEKAGLAVQEKQNEADLYPLRAQINSYYFNLLLLERQRELVLNYLGIIGKRLCTLEAAVANGMLLPSDIDVLTSEKIRMEQQLAENRIHRVSLLKTLSSLTGSPMDTSVVLVLPPVGELLPQELNRPELELFDLKKEQLAASLELLQAGKRPKAFGFATLGYGNPPGNNFFKDEFAPFYIIGAAVKWNIFDWDKTRNEKQVVTLQQSLLEGRKEELTDHLTRALDAQRAEIQSLEALLARDDELIALRKRITATAESQYANGTLTATEYLNELNAEKQAMVNREIHAISLVMARVGYLNISGREIE